VLTNAGDLPATAPSPVLRNPASRDIPKIPSHWRRDLREYSPMWLSKAIGDVTPARRYRLN
jgi:hypothetical protein